MIHSYYDAIMFTNLTRARARTHAHTSFYDNVRCILSITILHLQPTAICKACGWGTFFTNCSKDYTHPSPTCKLANTNALQFVPKTWDPYSILAPTCHDGTDAGDKHVSAYTPQLDAMRKRHGIDTSYDPCISKQSPIYMNNPAVIKALHAENHYNREWPSHPPNWSYGDEKADIALIFPEFFKKAPNWRILVVSGDADAAVPFVGTERWIKCLGRPETKPFKNWLMNGDVAGSVQQWKGITFQTVKGCGHTIPTYASTPLPLHPCFFCFFFVFVGGLMISRTLTSTTLMVVLN